VKELGGEHVAERVRRESLRLVDGGGARCSRGYRYQARRDADRGRRVSQPGGYIGGRRLARNSAVKAG